MTARDDRLTRWALRGADAADDDLDQAQRTRAAATLEWIVSTDPDEPSASADPAGDPRRRRRRLPLIGSAVACAGAAAVATVLIVSHQDTAFASWSPTPVELTGTQRTSVADACLVLQSGDAGGLAFDSRAKASVLLAEARGGWSYVLLRVAGLSGVELQASCLIPDHLVTEPRPGEGGFFGSLERADETSGPAPAPDAVQADTTATGSVDDEMFEYAEGRAGADVGSIEVITPSGRHVKASIAHGRWAAWWPSGDDVARSPQRTGPLIYKVTLRAGNTRGDVDTPR